MACTSLSPFTKECGKNQAGVQENYMISYGDLAIISGSTQPYATTVGGLVNQISLASSKKFVKVDNTRKSLALKASGQLSDSGVATSNAEYTLGLDGFNAKTGAFIDSLMGNPVVIITKLRTGKYIVVGLDGGFVLTSYEAAVDEAANGATLNFSGDTNGIPPELDATVVPSLI
ncbi:hypothetical protein [Pedobacter aquatilis]|uniref:hypothetical protein n=1 Tax=Pedobacter aquatilis TaxID=351343 RepID=UPI002930283A|nr:hypothetical protein [Pedobacter aquatilis]